MDGGKKIAEGGYGCVFHPEISCSGKETNNTKYISKIQHADFSSQNEVLIGKLLKEAAQKLPGNPLENNFAPVISSCPISLGQLKAKDVDQCNILKK
mgnify:FL=1